MVAIHLIPCFLMWSPEYLHPPKSHRHERHGGAHFQNELSLNESEKMVQDAVQGVQKQNESVWQRGWDRVKGMGEKGVWVGHKKRVQRNCEEERKTGWHKQNNQRERERKREEQPNAESEGRAQHSGNAVVVYQNHLFADLLSVLENPCLIRFKLPMFFRGTTEFVPLHKIRTQNSLLYFFFFLLFLSL